MATKRQTSSSSYEEQQAGFNAHIEGRVGRLEGAVENLTHEVQETSKVVRDIASGLGKFKEDVLSHIGVATAPKWPLIVSFVSICLTILALGGTIVGQIMSGQSAAIAKLAIRMDTADERDLKAAHSEGKHEAWREQADKILKDLDEKLQREMRLINDTTESRIAALDKSNQTKLGELQTQVAAIKDWRLDHVQENAKTHGKIEALFETHEQDIKRLESRVFDITQSVSQLDFLKPGVGSMKVCPNKEELQPKLKK